MESRQIGITQAPHLFQPFQRQAGVAFDRHSDLLRRFEFSSELFGRVLPDGRKKIAVDATEVTLDMLFVGNGLNAINRGGMTFVIRFGAVEAAHPDYGLEAVV